MNQLVKKGLLAWLFFCTSSLFPFVLQASHLLGGHLTWTAKDSNQVQFKFIAVFELDDVKKLFSDPNDFLVDAIFEDITGDTKLFFGDESSTLLTHYQVIDFDSADNWVRCIAIDSANIPDLTLLHTYTNEEGPWKATIDGCCRIDDLENADDNDRFEMSTFVVAASGIQSPESLRVPFVRLPKGGERSFKIPFSEGNLSWRLAGSNESTVTRQSINSKNNDDLKVDSQGLLTWNTDSLDIDGLWTAQLIVGEDIDGNTVEVPFDFAIKIIENQDPVCEAPDRHIVRLGETLNFTVTASDTDSASGDEVTLNVNVLPDGAEMNPALPKTGNLVVSTFSWTPLATDLGDHKITFSATDIAGSEDNCTVTISVEDTLCQVEIVSPQDDATVCDDSVQVAAVVKAASGFEVVPGACTINDVIANVIDDTLLVAKIPVEFGPSTIKVQCVLVSAQDDTTICSDMIQVNRAGSPKCFVRIIARVGSELPADSLTVSWTTEVEGGSLPFAIICDVNGISVSKTADSFKTNFSASIPLNPGDNQVVVTCIVVDNCGRETVCRDSIQVGFIPVDLIADAGPDKSICFGDSVQIGGNPTGSGGIGPLTLQWTPNGLNSLTVANPIAKPNMTTLYVVTVTDSTGQSDSDTVTVTVHPKPVADAGPSPNLSPGQSVKIGGSPTASGGTPPYVISWSPTAGLDDPTIANPTATVDTTITYFVTVTDANGCTATSSVEVKPEPPGDSCKVEIRYPMDGEFVCDDSVNVTASVGLIKDQQANCNINGIEAPFSESLFSATIPLTLGNNEIIATCQVSTGPNTIVCADTISVFSDPTPPICELDYNNYPDINGKIIDNESGIVFFEVLDLGNRILIMDNVEIAPGEGVEFNGDTEITFVLKKIDVNETGSFDLRMVNRAGCEISCDPIDLTLRSEGPPCNFSFSLPQRDRWLYVENHGLTRIEFVVNEMSFNLKVTGGLGNEANSYTIPGYGIVGFDLKQVLQTGENNFRLDCEGPPGSYANILIADYLRNDVGVPEELEFQEVVIPKEFALMQNHPNPFNPATNIRFNIPDNFTDGIQVKLLIYNLMGQLVKTLVDEHRFPGEYTARWEGRNQRDEAVSSGIYIYQLVAGDFKLTKRMLFLK